MSSRLAIRALGTGLGLLFLAGSARAGVSFTSFAECEDPSTVSNVVLGTILDDGSVGFGTLSAKVCNSIVKKGVGLCKGQVKLAAKCNDKTLASLNDILLKQCDQLGNATQRSDCKTGVKGEVKSVKDDNKANKELGLSSCDTTFSTNLADACENGVVM